MEANADSVVLVTGGAGYIGSHACKALAAAGFTPVVFDNLTQGRAEAVKWGPLEVGDLCDPGRIDEVIAFHRPVAALHFAALACVPESVAEPERYYRVNVGGAVNLLEAMRRHGVGLFVLSSTCATYGLPERVPINEDTPQRPINPYGRSKLMVERILVDCEIASGMRHAALRYFNAAGADPEGELGEVHDPETHLIPLAIDAALGRRPALRLLGDDYPTPDGSCIRDYIHVSDLADAHVAALKHLLGGGESLALNLGTGLGHSVRQILAVIERVVGAPVPCEIGPRRPGDAPALVADASAAREVLNWTPRFPEIETIVRHAYQWRARG